MTDYKDYEFSKKEWILELLKALAQIVFLGWLFFRSVYGCVLLFPYGFYLIYRKRMEKAGLIVKELRMNFSEVLTSISYSLQAGYTMEQSVGVALEDIMRTHEKGECPMIGELLWMKQNMELRIPVESQWKDLAIRSGVEEIRSFAVVLAVGRRQGGNLVRISQEAADRISRSIQVQMEIEQVIAGRQMEKRIMVWMPYFILIYLGVTNASYLKPLFQNWYGRILMGICLLITLGARAWAERIVDVEV